MVYDVIPKNIIPFLWFYIKKYRKFFFFYVIVSLLAGLWNPLNFYFLSGLVASISVPGIETSVQYGYACALVINFILFDNVTWRLISYLKSLFLPHVLNDADDSLLKFTLHHSHSFFQEKMAGSIIKQLFAVLDGIEQIIANFIPHFFRMVTLLILAFFFSYRIHYLFFLILIFWLFLFVLTSLFLFKKLDFLAQEQSQKESVLGGQISDSITNAAQVKLFSHVSYEVERRQGAYYDYTLAYKKKEKYSIFLNAIQGGLISLMIGLGIYFLVVLYLKKIISLGDFSFIITLYIDTGHMMWWTMSILQDYRKVSAKMTQGLDGLLIPIEIQDKKEAIELTLTGGSISFESVSFSYKKNQALIFDSLSLSIRAGEKVGLVGCSGAGKSTFVNLILRLFEVQEGKITIDGIDIRDVSQSTLRENIAIIPQDVSLFHRSLWENIGYGNLHATKKEIRSAAQKAYADEFITALPHGYDTLVGDRGLKLSGGQRQRIAIARAFLKNAPILILDEATSALDSHSEKCIQKSLDHLMREKTVIVIAHRLSTLLQMDRIIVFDGGRIIEEGTHEELLKKKGMYEKLWGMQSGEFIPEEFNYE